MIYKYSPSNEKVFLNICITQEGISYLSSLAPCWGLQAEAIVCCRFLLTQLMFGGITRAILLKHESTHGMMMNRTIDNLVIVIIGPESQHEYYVPNIIPSLFFRHCCLFLFAELLLFYRYRNWVFGGRMSHLASGLWKESESNDRAYLVFSNTLSLSGSENFVSLSEQIPNPHW